MTPDEKVAWALSIAHQHLDMDVSWLTRFAGDDDIVEAVAGDASSFRVAPGTRLDHPGSYCARVLAGTLPSVVQAARDDPRTEDLAVTRRLGIGAYVGAPVVLDDGRVFGMLCCLSHETEPSLRERDGQFLTVVAELLSDSVSVLYRDSEEHRRTTERIMNVIRSGGPTVVFQPVVDLTTGWTVGAEALARFPTDRDGPEQWFADAEAVGLGTELEMAAVHSALADLCRLPDGMVLAVNASARTVATDLLMEVLADVPAGRIVVEITEHERIEDYPATQAGLAALRGLGARIAVDDVGVGYAGLHQLVQLLPDVVKMDIHLTHGVDTDPARRALTEALVRFTHDIGATLLAEGVETNAQLGALTDIGVDLAQGLLLGAPGPLPLPVTRPAACQTGELPGLPLRPGGQFGRPVPSTRLQRPA